jgi:hypothetical protein
VSRLRWTLVALLVASTALFAVGVTAERSDSDTHVDVTTPQAEATGTEQEGAHDESGESGETEAGEAHSETASGETDPEDERVLGVDLESTPLLVLAVLAGLGLAGLTATRLGRLRGFLLAVMAIALVWAVLDVREVVHQFDESRTGVALLAISVAVLHLAAAVSGRLAQQTGAQAP